MDFDSAVDDQNPVTFGEKLFWNSATDPFRWTTVCQQFGCIQKHSRGQLKSHALHH